MCRIEREMSRQLTLQRSNVVLKEGLCSQHRRPTPKHKPQRNQTRTISKSRMEAIARKKREEYEDERRMDEEEKDYDMDDNSLPSPLPSPSYTQGREGCQNTFRGVFKRVDSGCSLTPKQPRVFAFNGSNNKKCPHITCELKFPENRRPNPNGFTSLYNNVEMNDVSGVEQQQNQSDYNNNSNYGIQYPSISCNNNNNSNKHNNNTYNHKDNSCVFDLKNNTSTTCQQKMIVNEGDMSLDRESGMKEGGMNGGEKLTLPTIEGKINDCNSITPDTMCQLLEGAFERHSFTLIIVDCRYPYEYNGGHIMGAINLFTKDLINQRFITDKMDERTIVVFHCEFSSKRGPSMYRHLRNKDRSLNIDNYPRLFYPEMYLIEGGYKAFFEGFANFCEPKLYLKMDDVQHRQELKFFKSRAKTWTAGDKENKGRALRKNEGWISPQIKFKTKKGLFSATKNQSISSIIPLNPSLNLSSDTSLNSTFNSSIHQLHNTFKVPQLVGKLSRNVTNSTVLTHSPSSFHSITSLHSSTPSHLTAQPSTSQSSISQFIDSPTDLNKIFNFNSSEKSFSNEECNDGVNMSFGNESFNLESNQACNNIANNNTPICVKKLHF